MGKSKKSRSRSPDHSKERTSKRLRKLEEKMDELTSGFALIKDAILRRSRSYSNSGESDIEGTGSGDDKSIGEKDDNGEVVDLSSNSQSQTNKNKENGTPWELDAEDLRIFGAEPIEEKPELILHSSVANRWKKYLSEGIKKEIKESLLEKYPRKGKLSFEPPILNEEVAGNLKESALKRDTYFGSTQKLAGSALAALAPVIESLATLKDPDNVKRLEQVWDAAKLFGDGVDHSTINSARAALSLISSEDVSNNPLISRFVKGASKIRPGGRGPKYESTWDVDPVLAKLESWAPVEELSPKKLTEKLVVLIPERIKTSRPGAPQPVLRLPFFQNKPELCIARTLNQYVTVTKDLRGSNDSLFISLNKPYGAVKSETIARWIRSALESLGVDKRFTAHSTRHASTSRAHEKGVSIDEIKKVAGWSKNSKVFADFYHQPINIRDKNFAEAVLTPST
ncbi:Protein of unknown function [Cotesia congregata]|uniref:Tyr recombinase domain-containing protein n=1 Tax=Cotesia congregata TaxID=51543 RepID=A0A8J2H5T0_COTCN|nr:Protein of unknown function [Cotesia congregata]